MESEHRYRHAHLVGIGGIGISAVARMLARKGAAISGSDAEGYDERLLPTGTYNIGHDADLVPKETDVLVYSDAVPVSNPERRRADALSIPQMNFSRMLGELTKAYDTIAISGTHGKSTTTALTGLFFEAAGMDPSVFVGAVVPQWRSNYREGKSRVFIVEADEYREHMMELSPKCIVLTNLELDHPDYYRDIIHLMSIFSGYIHKLPADGILIVNKDDHNTSHAANSANARVITYSAKDRSADLYIKRAEANDGSHSITIWWKGTERIQTTTPLPGAYNMMNIAAASTALLAHGGDLKAIEQVLPTFRGIGRRFEVLGMRGKTVVISDYAHHPTALALLKEAAAERFPGGKVLFAFRPHQQQRTRVLYDAYKKVIDTFDDIVLIEVYDVVGREAEERISSEPLLGRGKRATDGYSVFARDLDEAKRLILDRINDYDAVVVVGAGDADKLARALLP